jgi:hypothetical protein
MNSSEYQNYLDIVNKITKHDSRSEDLLHDILIQLKDNAIFNSLSGNAKNYFFVKVVKNQYSSNNSKFKRNYRRHEYTELVNNTEIPDEEYIETPDMLWVIQTLEKELNREPNNWYDIELFKLYLKHKKIETLHRTTKIPKYSLRITINKIKTFLREEWLKQN